MPPRQRRGRRRGVCHARPDRVILYGAPPSGEEILLASEPMSDDPAAALPRRPTGHPDRFLIPNEQLPPGFAARVEEPVGEPAAPRPAATVVLMREAEGGPEVLLLRRPQRSRFAADAWVFPGGAVDAGDARPELLAPAGAEGWAERLRLADEAEAAGYVVAALREAWEETGILLAAPAAGRPWPGAEALRRARESLLAEGRPFAELLEEAGLRLSSEDLLYVAHWITPLPEPRRFDTRFFVARVPPGTGCELRGDELTEARWAPPGRAVEEFEAGAIKLLPPTVQTLRRLVAGSTLEEVWRALRAAPVPTILPRMRRVPDGVVIDASVETP
jgi:8-oxo-dGTP pyrophosphatase MutT (NUDIX family)